MKELILTEATPDVVKKGNPEQLHILRHFLLLGLYFSFMTMMIIYYDSFIWIYLDLVNGR